MELALVYSSYSLFASFTTTLNITLTTTLNIIFTVTLNTTSIKVVTVVCPPPTPCLSLTRIFPLTRKPLSNLILSNHSLMNLETRFVLVGEPDYPLSS